MTWWKPLRGMWMVSNRCSSLTFGRGTCIGPIIFLDPASPQQSLCAQKSLTKVYLLTRRACGQSIHAMLTPAYLKAYEPTRPKPT